MLSHTALLVIGGALLTGLLGALVFGSNGTAEERRIREEQKLLRALDAQRRIRDAQLLRQARQQRQPYRETPPPSRVDPEPVADGQVADDEPMPDHRATERQRKREEKEQAVALKSEREGEKHAQRLAEQERKAALKADKRNEKENAATLKAERGAEERARRAADEERKREEREHAVALKAQRQADEHKRAVAAKSAPAAPPPREPEPAVAADELDKPLTELPLFSWATRIETEDRDPAP
jgi:hypothetical protein